MPLRYCIFLGVVTHNYNPTTQEAEMCASWLEGQPGYIEAVCKKLKEEGKEGGEERAEDPETLETLESHVNRLSNGLV